MPSFFTNVNKSSNPRKRNTTNDSDAESIIMGGYPVNSLSSEWIAAIKKFSQRGGSGEQKLGKLKEMIINSRKWGPVHQSHFDRSNKEPCISVKVKGEYGAKTCHIYADSTGTTAPLDDRR